MALTGTKLIHMRSATAAAVPTAAQLGDGQIAINTADRLIFIKDSSGNVIAVASAAAVAAASTAVQTVNTKSGPNVTLAPSDIGTNGVAALDSNGKIQLVNIPDSILGGVNYQGTWDASTNTPTLVSPPDSTTKGFYYKVTVAGTQFGIDFTVGDWIISNGAAWDKVDAQDTVASVNGKTGAVVLNAVDVGALALTGGTVTGPVTFEDTVVVPAPTAAGQAANRQYVDAAIASIPRTSGTVTSVDVSTPSFLTSTGGPVTDSGTIALGLATQAANTVFAGPGTGADAEPTFRALVTEDIASALVGSTMDEGTYA